MGAPHTHAIPLGPPLDPLHRYKLGKRESKLSSHPLQTRYKAVTGGVTMQSLKCDVQVESFEAWESIRNCKKLQESEISEVTGDW